MYREFKSGSWKFPTSCIISCVSVLSISFSVFGTSWTVEYRKRSWERCSQLTLWDNWDSCKYAFASVPQPACHSLPRYPPLIRCLHRRLCHRAAGSAGRVCTEAICLRKARCYRCSPLTQGVRYSPCWAWGAGGMRCLAAPLEPGPVIVVTLHIRYFFLGMKGPSLFQG